MCGVAVAFMHVVDVVVVWDGNVTATLAMGMLVGTVSGVRGRLALVKVAIMGFVQMALMHVVNVVAVRDGDMTTALTVNVAVAGVFDMGCRHKMLLSYKSRAKAYVQTIGAIAFFKPWNDSGEFRAG